MITCIIRTILLLINFIRIPSKNRPKQGILAVEKYPQKKTARQNHQDLISPRNDRERWDFSLLYLPLQKIKKYEHFSESF
jgi:hypothetical protein